MIRAAILACLIASPLWAVEPAEMLENPALEARARALSTELRCPVCRNESIDESNAILAKELRIILRERLVAGDSDAQAVDYLVQRYGEFILLNPPVSGANWILWTAAPAMFLLAIGVGIGAIRRRPATAETMLSDSEKTRLDQILRD